MRPLLFFLLFLLFNTIEAQTHFSASQNEGCGQATVNFTTNNPSGGYMPQPFQTTGFTYNWNFGNGTTSTLQNPNTVNYNSVGNFWTNYTCNIDTSGFYLKQITVNLINCSDPFSGDPDIYIIVRDNSNNVVYTTESSYVEDTDPPLSWTMNIQLNNPPYFIWVWDYDSADDNDNCVDGTENQPGTATILTLPANNSTTFGSSTKTYNNGGLSFDATFQKDVVTYHDSVLIAVNALPSEPVLSLSNSSFCLGETIPTIVASGSIGNIINWYNDSALTQLLHTGALYNPVVNLTGTYTLYVTQSDTSTNCTSEVANITLTVLPLAPPVFDMYSDEFCTGEFLPSVTASGENILWYNDSSLTTEIGQGNSFQIPQMPVGTYSYYAIQNDTVRNCISSSSEFVATFIQGIDIDFNVENISCFGFFDGQIAVTPTSGASPFIYSWSNGETTQNISNLPIDEYSLTIIDANFCLNIYSFDITQPIEITSQSTQTNNLCFGDQNASIVISANGGTAPYTYLWSNGGNSSSVNNLSIGTYGLTTTDANNCSITASFLVTQPDSMVLDYSLVNESCNGSNDGNIDVNVQGGVSPYQFLWSNQSNSETLENLHIGSYTLTISDANLCTIQKSIQIIAEHAICLDIPNVITPNADGNNDYWNIKFIQMYPNALIKIFNRWGQLVFESKGYTQNFDGIWNGKNLPIGSYFYIIDLNNNTENSIYTGTIDIIR